MGNSGSRSALRPGDAMQTFGVRSAREDTIRGRIDTLAGHVLEAYARMTGKRSAAVKGKAARTRGAFRRAKGRFKHQSEK